MNDRSILSHINGEGREIPWSKVAVFLAGVLVGMLFAWGCYEVGFHRLAEHLAHETSTEAIEYRAPVSM